MSLVIWGQVRRGFLIYQLKRAGIYPGARYGRLIHGLRGDTKSRSEAAITFRQVEKRFLLAALLSGNRGSVPGLHLAALTSAF